MEQTNENITQQTEEEKKKAFEEAEAKRKAEFEAKKAAHDEEILLEWEMKTMVSDEKLVSTAEEEIRKGVERITQRNMKESVAAHVIGLLSESKEMSRNALHPQKNISNCFRYINRKARKYAEEQMKLTGEKPDKDNVLAMDIPDHLCYQWAEEYYRSTDTPEDHEDEEKFEPKTYRPGYTPKTVKKPTPKKAEPPKEEKKEEAPQLSLFSA